jgi:hypothetical protein
VKNIQTPCGLFFITKNAMLGDLHGARKVQESKGFRDLTINIQDLNYCKHKNRHGAAIEMEIFSEVLVDPC